MSPLFLKTVSLMPLNLLREPMSDFHPYISGPLEASPLLITIGQGSVREAKPTVSVIGYEFIIGIRPDTIVDGAREVQVQRGN